MKCADLIDGDVFACNKIFIHAHRVSVMYVT